jgi:hypothetical protein
MSDSKSSKEQAEETAMGSPKRVLRSIGLPAPFFPAHTFAGLDAAVDVLMMEIPIAIERERLEQLCTASTRAVQEALQSSKACQKQLNEHLARLPDRIAEGIHPEVIAAAINESLRQQFVQSTIPETARALTLVGERMKEATAAFGQTASTLARSYQGAAEEARRAMGGMETSISRAADAAGRAASELSWVFNRTYRWSLYALCGLALLIGLGLGMLLQRWIEPPEHTGAAVHQTVAPAVNRYRR